MIDARRLAAGEKSEDYATSDALRTHYLGKARECLTQPTNRPRSLAKQNADLRETLATILGTFTDQCQGIIRSQWLRTDLVEQWRQQVREAG